MILGSTFESQRKFCSSRASSCLSPTLLPGPLLLLLVWLRGPNFVCFWFTAVPLTWAIMCESLVFHPLFCFAGPSATIGHHLLFFACEAPSLLTRETDDTHTRTHTRAIVRSPAWKRYTGVQQADLTKSFLRRPQAPAAPTGAVSATAIRGITSGTYHHVIALPVA